MGNATGIFNLIRNLGGSFGIAFSATMLARHQQINQSNLITHLIPTGRNFQYAFESLQALPPQAGFYPGVLLPQIGFDPASRIGFSYGVINGSLQQQALMLAFNDSFRFLFFIFFFTFLFLILLRRPRYAQDETAMLMH